MEPGVGYADAEAVGVGSGLTTPVPVGIFTVAALVAVQLILPEAPLPAFDWRRTQTLVFAMVLLPDGNATVTVFA